MFKMASRCSFLAVFLITAANSQRVSPDEGDSCQHSFFEKASQGAISKQSVVSTHHARSWLDCGQLCRHEKKGACLTFSYRDEAKPDEINCQLSSQFKTIESIQPNNDGWSIYEIRDAELERCLVDELCQNGGQCIPNPCAPEGFSCKCTTRHHGEHCEREQNDYDVSFTQRSVESYVQMNAITSNLTQMTFTTWFKMHEGLREYHLLSYAANGTDVYIELFFGTVGESDAISKFHMILGGQELLTNIIPVNDGFWHHFGFTWTNTGNWNVFIDGTLRVLRKCLRGKIIPGGGRLVIGQKLTTLDFVPGSGFVGIISRLNLWDTALSGYRIESMAELPGDEAGNLIRWFEVLDNVVGDFEVISPSTAYKTDKDLDFQLSFPSPPNGKDYIRFPGPARPVEDLSVCLWIKIQTHSTFISYDTDEEIRQTFAFGIDSNHLMFAYVNGTSIRSTSPKRNITNNLWHFLCLTLNGRGVVTFYHDLLSEEIAHSEKLKPVLAPGGNFSVGIIKSTIGGSNSSSIAFAGIMSYLNIWSSFMTLDPIYPMAAGGGNVNGDLLSWREMPKWIVGNVNITRKIEIRFPGYGVLAERSQWCNHHVNLSCGDLYARLGQGRDHIRMAWRCYCGVALVPSKYTYRSGGKSGEYETMHEDLIKIT